MSVWLGSAGIWPAARMEHTPLQWPSAAALCQNLLHCIKRSGLPGRRRRRSGCGCVAEVGEVVGEAGGLASAGCLANGCVPAGLQQVVDGRSGKQVERLRAALASTERQQTVCTMSRLSQHVTPPFVKHITQQQQQQRTSVAVAAALPREVVMFWNAAYARGVFTRMLACKQTQTIRGQAGLHAGDRLLGQAVERGLHKCALHYCRSRGGRQGPGNSSSVQQGRRLPHSAPITDCLPSNPPAPTRQPGFRSLCLQLRASCWGQRPVHPGTCTEKQGAGSRQWGSRQ